MGLALKYTGRKIFLDTAPVIYYIEENERYLDFLTELFDLAKKNEIQFVTSSLTLLELLVLPIRQKQHELAQAYRDIILNSGSIVLVSMNVEIAVAAANIRANYNFKTPDAIQIASAINSNCNLFLTNDKKLNTSEIETIYLEQTSANQ